MTLTVRPWNTDDWTAVQPMVRACLQATYDVGGDLQPSDRNVTALCQLGIAWARRGAPTLVAVFDEAIVGLTLWGALGAPLELDMRDGAVCTALMTYVTPAYRHAGVATQLRRAAFAVATAKGYRCVKGAVQLQNTAGLRSVEAVGFAKTAVEVEKTLSC